MPTFVVEDGTGLSNATSYLSDTEADDILSIQPSMNPIWSGLTQPDKQTWLMWATNFVDTYSYFNGTRLKEDQSLKWPRENSKTCEGIDIPDNVVPQQIKRITAWIAGYYATNATINPYKPLDEQLDIKKIKIAELAIEYTDDMRTAKTNLYPPFLDNNILDCLGFWDLPTSGTSTFGYIY